MHHVSPLRLIRLTRAWLPLAVLVVALALFAVSWGKARTAHLLDAYGEIAVAEVLDKDVRITEDADGNRRTTYRLRYRFLPVEGPEVERRAAVDRAMYDRLAVGDGFELRYVRHDPEVHELAVGAARAEAGRLRLAGWAMLAVAAGMAAWVAQGGGPLVRALLRGTTRTAVVTAHEARPQRKASTGARHGRLHWRDETGADGVSGWLPMLTVAGQPLGSRITVIVDVPSGRAWWDEELDPDGGG